MIGIDAPGIAGSKLAMAARSFELIGGGTLRYGLMLLLLGIGILKFTEPEAAAIEPWVSHSPFLSWLYPVTTLEGASDLIGTVEITIALLLAAYHWFPRSSAIGSLGASITFLVTLSFLFTTPALSPDAAGFLMKDFMLLGAALWTAGQSLRRAQSTVTAAERH